jgi:hypothetical protein
MHILFDSLSSQVQVHRRLNIRMNTLLGAIHSEGWTYSFSRPPLTAGQLDACDVLAILTRTNVDFNDATNFDYDASTFEYSKAEISAIRSFLGRGRGLLLISNHGPKPKSSGDDKYGDTKYDRTLADAFKVVLHPAYFHTKDTLMTMNMDAGQLNSEHQHGVLFQVKEIAVHNSCGIQVKAGVDFQWIAKFPKHTVDGSPDSNYKPADHYYAIRLYHNNGRVIIAGNSGLAGDDGSTIPAHGTILYANNLLFLLNCFKELAGLKPTF